MITFTHCFLARNSSDVTIKHVHTEKHSNVNRWVVAVFKSRHWRYELFKTVCHFVVHISKNTDINFYWNRPSFRRCRHPTKIFLVKMTVPFTNGVSAERGTSWLRHRWHRLPLSINALAPNAKRLRLSHPCQYTVTSCQQLVIVSRPTSVSYGGYNSIVIQSQIGALKSINDQFITANSLAENKRPIQSLHG